MKLSQVYANVELSALFQQAPGGHIIPYGQIWKLQYVYSFIGSNSIPLKLDCIPLMGINYPVLSTNKYSAIFSKAIFNTEFFKAIVFSFWLLRNIDFSLLWYVDLFYWVFWKCAYYNKYFFSFKKYLLLLLNIFNYFYFLPK